MSEPCYRLALGDAIAAAFQVCVFAFSGYFAAEVVKLDRFLAVAMVPALIATLSLTAYVPFSISVYVFRRRLGQRSVGLRSAVSILVTYLASLLGLALFICRAGYEFHAALGSVGTTLAVFIGGIAGLLLATSIHSGVPELPRVARLFAHLPVLAGLVSFWMAVAISSLGLATVATSMVVGRWDLVMEHLRRDLVRPFGLSYLTASALIGVVDYLHVRDSGRRWNPQRLCLRPSYRGVLGEILKALSVRYVIYLPEGAYEATVKIINRAIESLRERRRKPGEGGG